MLPNVWIERAPALLQNGTGRGTGVSVLYPPASSDVWLWFVHTRYHRYAVCVWILFVSVMQMGALCHIFIFFVCFVFTVGLCYAVKWRFLASYHIVCCPVVYISCTILCVCVLFMLCGTSLQNVDSVCGKPQNLHFCCVCNCWLLNDILCMIHGYVYDILPHQSLRV